jgi:transposase
MASDQRFGTVKQDDRVWTATTLSEFLAEHHGVQIGRSGLSGQLKKMGLSFQRTRHVVAGQADEQEKEDLKRDLDALKKGRSRN